MKFTRAELDSFRGATVPDLVGPEVRLLFVGINPGLWTAAVQGHFSRRGNRFYPALFRGGVVDRPIDASAGLSAEDRDHLLERGIGITNLVATATARADELRDEDIAAGALALTRRIPRIAPAVVAILGVTAYRIGFAAPRAAVGRQPRDLGGAQLWVAPNPSGLNAHSRLDDLARAYREVAVAAGIDVGPSLVDAAPAGTGSARP